MIETEEKVRILINEDSKGDLGLMLNELDNSSLNYITEVVDTEEDFENGIKTFHPDIILSDYSQPFFDGVSAFNAQQKLAPHIPFLLVSGTIGEEVAVELIKSGVVDYVLKSKLYSLVAKIERALAEAKAKNEKQKAQEEILKLNAELEERVAQRTAELLEANKALESFSYSVSHDLRSPLRSILGFTQLIQKEYSPSFTADANELFGHIEKNSVRMNIIIEDLLTLAKFTKERLQLAPVNTSALVQSVWDNLLFTQPHKAKLQVDELPAVQADTSMLEQVLVNLISNAIKYSAKNEKPIVQIGCFVKEEVATFYVKDNGAGFDMKKYGRLFGAFQRLHGKDEFEGTGVGLHLVKRIIEKHNGSVWAEAKPNEGATFYFTLPLHHEFPG